MKTTLVATKTGNKIHSYVTLEGYYSSRTSCGIRYARTLSPNKLTQASQLCGCCFNVPFLMSLDLFAGFRK